MNFKVYITTSLWILPFRFPFILCGLAWAGVTGVSPDESAQTEMVPDPKKCFCTFDKKCYNKIPKELEKKLFWSQTRSDDALVSLDNNKAIFSRACMINPRTNFLQCRRHIRNIL